MKKPITFLIMLSASTLCANAANSNPTEFDKGFKQALMCLALVNLEYSTIKKDPKTFGEMGEICIERYNVNPEPSWK